MIPLFVKKGLLHYCNGIIFKAKLPDPINRSEKQKHTCTLRMRARWQVSAPYARINTRFRRPLEVVAVAKSLPRRRGRNGCAIRGSTPSFFLCRVRRRMATRVAVPGATPDRIRARAGMGCSDQAISQACLRPACDRERAVG